MLIQDFLHASVARRPGKVALVCGAHRYTYAQIEDMANRLAHALCQGGVQRGDRVGVCLPNNWAAVVSIFGVLKAGAVFVPINPGVKPDKLQYILNNCRAAALNDCLNDSLLNTDRHISCSLFGRETPSLYH